jgi:hypothetical protein
MLPPHCCLFLVPFVSAVGHALGSTRYLLNILPAANAVRTRFQTVCSTELIIVIPLCELLVILTKRVDFLPR